jgi:hypothetical protein
MTKFLTIFALIEAAIILISWGVITALMFMVKSKERARIRANQQALIDSEKYKKKLVKEREYYDAKAKNAKDSTDIVNIFTELMSDDDYNPR